MTGTPWSKSPGRNGRPSSCLGLLLPLPPASPGASLQLLLEALLGLWQRLGRGFPGASHTEITREASAPQTRGVLPHPEAARPAGCL